MVLTGGLHHTPLVVLLHTQQHCNVIIYLWIIVWSTWKVTESEQKWSFLPQFSRYVFPYIRPKLFCRAIVTRKGMFLTSDPLDHMVTFICMVTWLLRLTASLLNETGWGQSAWRKTCSWMGWSTWKLGDWNLALHWTAVRKKVVSAETSSNNHINLTAEATPEMAFIPKKISVFWPFVKLCALSLQSKIHLYWIAHMIELLGLLTEWNVVLHF